MDNFSRSLLDKPDLEPIGTVRYDPGVIQDFAEKMYEHAWFIVVLCTIGGAGVGAVVGYVLSAGHNSGIFAGVGAALLGLFAFWVAQTYAFYLRLRAQMALCQLRIEQNTRPVNPRG